MGLSIKVLTFLVFMLCYSVENYWIGIMLNNENIVVKYMDGGVIQIGYDADQRFLIENHILPKVFEWISNNIPDVTIGDGGYHMTDHSCYKYIHTTCEEDLMAFKMRWL